MKEKICKGIYIITFTKKWLFHAQQPETSFATLYIKKLAKIILIWHLNRMKVENILVYIKEVGRRKRQI